MALHESKKNCTTWNNGCNCSLKMFGHTQTTERDNWTDDRTAELQMNGLSELDAKRKAMEDWHTYKGSNV